MMDFPLPEGFYRKSFMLLFSILSIRINTLPANRVSALFQFMLWSDAISAGIMSIFYVGKAAGISAESRLPLLILSEIAENTQIVLAMWLMLLLVLILYGSYVSYISVYTALIGSVVASSYYVFALLNGQPSSLLMLSATCLMGLITVIKIVLAVSASYELLRLKEIRFGQRTRSNFVAIYREKYLANELFLFMIYVFLVFDFFVFLPHVLEDIPEFDEWYIKYQLWQITQFFYTIRPMVNYILLYCYARVKSQRRSVPRRRHQAAQAIQSENATADCMHNNGVNQFAYDSFESTQITTSNLHNRDDSHAPVKISRFTALVKGLAAKPVIDEQRQPLLHAEWNDRDTEIEGIFDDRLSNLVNFAQENHPFQDVEANLIALEDCTDFMQDLGVKSSLLAFEKGAWNNWFGDASGSSSNTVNLSNPLTSGSGWESSYISTNTRGTTAFGSTGSPSTFDQEIGVKKSTEQ